MLMLVSVFMLSILACLAARFIALHVGFTTPDCRFTRDGQAVVFGGIAGPLVGLLACFAGGFANLPLLLAVAGFGLLGMVDDAVEMPVSQKLSGQILISVGVAIAGWIETSDPVSLLLAPACLVLVNGVNLVDVADGLAGGFAVLAFLALAPALNSVEAIFAASTLAFLIFNWPQARMYLGDAGSMALGGGLAVMVHDGAVRGQVYESGLAGAPFLAEILVLIILRANAGLPFWLKSPHHMVILLGQLLPDKMLAVPVLWTWAALAWLSAELAGPLPQLVILVALPVYLVLRTVK